MAIKISKLWNDWVFKDLTKESKLLYIYLATSPEINSLGLRCLGAKEIGEDLGYDLKTVRETTRELISKDLIKVYRTGTHVWFFVMGHYLSLPKTQNIKIRVTTEATKIPKELIEDLKSDGLFPDFEETFKFVPPTKEEVASYCISKGFRINVEEYLKYYTERDWKDSRNKYVKDWKGKLRKVWFRNAEQIPKCDDAPKGYEHLFIEVDGNIITPDHWSNGKPVSKKGFIQNERLQQEYLKQKS